MRPARPTDDDRRRAAAVWLAFAACCALDVWLGGPRATRAESGGGAIGVIVGIANGLASLFGGGGKVDKTTFRYLTLLRDALVAYGQLFTGFAYETNGRLGKITSILGRFWDAILLPFIKKTDGKISSIYDWLKTTLGPVIEALKLLRKHIVDFYTKYFRPILDTIDAIRATLRVLSFLHIKVAEKLDAQLAALEQRLLKPLRVALETINRLIDWTERVITADGFFQRYTFITSLWRYERDAWKAWAGSLHLREKEHATAPSTWPKPTTVDDKVHESVAYLVGGDGPSKARIDEAVQDTMLNLRGASMLLA